MKKLRFACAALALLAASSALALEYGAILDDQLSLRVVQNEWKAPVIGDTATLTGNVRHAFTNDGTSYIAAEGLFRYAFSNAMNGISDSTHHFVLDLSLLKYGQVIPVASGSSLTVNAGRFFLADLTSSIFAQNGDGAQVQLRTNRLTAKAYLGYTGLLNGKTTLMLDGDANSSGYDVNVPLYELARSFLIAEGSVSVPYLFLNQSVQAELIAAFPLATESYPDKDDNRFYATVSLDGPLSPKLFYSASTTFSTKRFASVSNLSKVAVTYYPGYRQMSVGAAVTYASGNNGFLSPFVGLTTVTASNAADTQVYSGVLKAGLSASIKPVAKLLCSASADVLFGCEDGFAFSGVQVGANAKYQLFSDLVFAASAGTYIGAAQEQHATWLTLRATLSF